MVTVVLQVMKMTPALLICEAQCRDLAGADPLTVKQASCLCYGCFCPVSADVVLQENCLFLLGL